MLSTQKRKRKTSASVAQDEPDEDETFVAAPVAPSKRGQSGIANDAALLFKLQELTGGVDVDASDETWVETLVVTAPDPLAIDDVEDDLKRELAFYKQALGGVQLAQERMDRLGVPYRRPDDYFAEMAKTDEHMAKVKRRMINEQQAIQGAEERKKQRNAKKFGKQVQTAKVQERALQRKAALKEVASMQKARKGNQQSPEFDVELDDRHEWGDGQKRQGGEAGGAAAKRFKSGNGGGPPSKREEKERKYGKAHLRTDKRNTSESTDDMRGFNRERGGKGKGKGGGKGGGKGKGAAKARPGKERRRQAGGK